MAEDQEQSDLLYGIVEADETYVGGKPRKSNHRDPDNKGIGRGRGTKKTPVLGAVERGGKVVAEAAPDVTGKTIEGFLEKTIDRSGTLLVTDEWGGYNRFGQTVNHAVIHHKTEYVRGIAHTNTIEGFWSLVKRAWWSSPRIADTELSVSRHSFKLNRAEISQC